MFWRRLLPPSSGYKKSVIFTAFHSISVLPSADIFLCHKNSPTWNRVLRISVLWTAYELNAEFRNFKPSGRLRLKCDGTHAETRFRLSAKRTSPFKSAWALVHSTTGSRWVRISDSNPGYTMFRGSVKSPGYPLHSPVFLSLLLRCVIVCHHISTGFYVL
jgi:hypothetical protein